MKKKILNGIVISLLVWLSVNKFAYSSIPIKEIPFVNNQVIVLNASTFNVTEVQFGEDERIVNIQNGDIAAWTIDVGKNLPNTLFLKPTLPDSNTNMTVITNRHTYYFHLISDDKQSTPLYALKFIYPKSGISIPNLNRADDPENYNWDYSFHGSTTIMPLHVFDDGHFTYFQLRSKQVAPAIFVVDNKMGKEGVVNFRKNQGYLIVHRLAPQFTLRSGKYHVASIFNDRLIKAKNG